ncbi:MAG TPA: hypothetical protein VLZ76_05840, partial [Lysobacter sp.]|nr:hypothetical protein [Lysobacter sp.]
MAGLWSSSAIALDPCTSIPMPPGQNAAEVSGTTPGHGRDDDPGIQCYSLAVSRGQPVHVRLMGGENVAITIPDVGDARDEFEFVAKQDRYELHVFQLFPGGGDEAFRIQVETVPPRPDDDSAPGERKPTSIRHPASKSPGTRTQPSISTRALRLMTAL